MATAYKDLGRRSAGVQQPPRRTRPAFAANPRIASNIGHIVSERRSILCLDARTVAQASAVPLSDYRALEQGDFRLDADSLRRVAKSLDVDADKLVEEASDGSVTRWDDLDAAALTHMFRRNLRAAVVRDGVASTIDPIEPPVERYAGLAAVGIWSGVALLCAAPFIATALLLA